MENEEEKYFVITVGETELKAYRRTTSWLLALGVFFLLLVLVGLLLAVSYYATYSFLAPYRWKPTLSVPTAASYGAISPQSNPGSIQGNLVSAGGGGALNYQACTASPHAAWDGDAESGSCHCTDQYWGPSCTLPGIQSEFYTLGGPGATGLRLHPLAPPFFSNNLSSGNSPCTPFCAARDDCVGVSYSADSCTLLQGVELESQGQLPFHPLASNSLYMKREKRPVFHGQVWLAADKDSLPLRPWLNNTWGNPPSFSRLTPLSLTSLPFHPGVEVNADNLPGVFSDGRFSEIEARAALALSRKQGKSLVGVNGRTFYVRDAVTSTTGRTSPPFSPPLAWRHTLPLFAMYLWG